MRKVLDVLESFNDKVGYFLIRIHHGRMIDRHSRGHIKNYRRSSLEDLEFVLDIPRNERTKEQQSVLELLSEEYRWSQPSNYFRFASKKIRKDYKKIEKKIQQLCLEEGLYEYP